MVTGETIDAAPNLKPIQRTGIGVDMIDMAHAGEKKIPVSVCRGFNSVSVAELAVLDILALYRRLPFIRKLYPPLILEKHPMIVETSERVKASFPLTPSLVLQ